MIKVAISLKNTSQVINHEAKNTYEKGSFFCVYATDGTVYKYPTSEIWRVSESYGDSGRTTLLTE